MQSFPFDQFFQNDEIDEKLLVKRGWQSFGTRLGRSFRRIQIIGSGIFQRMFSYR